jgi:hypothetical protein
MVRGARCSGIVVAPKGGEVPQLNAARPCSGAPIPCIRAPSALRLPRTSSGWAFRFSTLDLRPSLHRKHKRSRRLEIGAALGGTHCPPTQRHARAPALGCAAGEQVRPFRVEHLADSMLGVFRAAPIGRVTDAPGLGLSVEVIDIGEATCDEGRLPDEPYGSFHAGIFVAT